MKKILYFLLLAVLFYMFGCKKQENRDYNMSKPSEKALTDLKYPNQMLISEKGIFVSEEGKIFHYSLKDYSLINILRKGKTNEISFSIGNKEILVYEQNTGKVELLSLSGGLIKKGEFPFFGTFMVFIFGDKIVRVSDDLKKGGKFVHLLDKNFEEIRKIAELRREDQKNGGIKTINIDSLSGRIKKRERKVYSGSFLIGANGNRLYIVDTAKGFFVRIFDINRNEIKTLKKEYNRVKCTKNLIKILSDAEKRELELAKPVKKRFLEIIKKLYKDKYPEYMPPFDDVFVGETKLFFRTYEYTRNGRKVKFLITDSECNHLKTVYLPVPSKGKYAFYKGAYYYLKKKEGKWYLVTKKIGGKN